MRCISLAGRAQQMVLELAERHDGDGGEGVAVDGIIDAHHRVDPAVVIGQRMVVEMLQRQVGQDGAGGFALRLAGGRQAGIAVAGLAEVGRSQQLFQPREGNGLIEWPDGVMLVWPRLRHGNRRKRSKFAHDTALSVKQDALRADYTWGDGSTSVPAAPYAATRAEKRGKLQSSNLLRRRLRQGPHPAHSFPSFWA